MQYLILCKIWYKFHTKGLNVPPKKGLTRKESDSVLLGGKQTEFHLVGGIRTTPTALYRVGISEGLPLYQKRDCYGCN